MGAKLTLIVGSFLPSILHPLLQILPPAFLNNLILSLFSICNFTPLFSLADGLHITICKNCQTLTDAPTGRVWGCWVFPSFVYKMAHYLKVFKYVQLTILNIQKEKVSKWGGRGLIIFLNCNRFLKNSIFFSKALNLHNAKRLRHCWILFRWKSIKK